MSENKNSVLPDVIEPISNAIQQNIPETAKQTDGALSTVVGFFNNVVLYPVKKANLTFRYKLESFEDDLKEKTKRADILIAAIGKPKFITKEYIKEGVTIIDVGIHRNEDNKLCGDVDFDDVKDMVEAITPVPGGVGPMTIAMLMKNCVECSNFF